MSSSELESPTSVDQDDDPDAGGGLLFVSCNGPKGLSQAKGADRTRMRRHIMREHLTRRTTAPPAQVQSTPRSPQVLKFGSRAQLKDKAFANRTGEKSPRENGEEALDIVRQPLPRHLTGNASFSHFSFSATEVGNIQRWYFLKVPRDQKPHSLTLAMENWAEKFWDMGKDDVLQFRTVAVYAAIQQVSQKVSGAESRYLQQKLGLIQEIRSHLEAKKEPSAGFVLAVSQLAYFETLDSNFQASTAHLTAIKSLLSSRNLSFHHWLFIYWPNFRDCLLHTTAPLLPYVLHPSCQDLITSEDTAIYSVNNAMECPYTDDSSAVTWSHLFHGLHNLCAINEDDVYKGHQDLPSLIGQIYDLEYRLRVQHHKVRRDGSEMTGAHCVAELVTLAIQLSVWISARHWVPPTPEYFLHILKRACEIISTSLVVSFWTDSIANFWTDYASKSCLLWTAFTLAASQRYNLEEGRIIFEFFLEAVHLNGLDNKDDLRNELQKWPWVKKWHDDRLDQILGGFQRFLRPFPGWQVEFRKAMSMERRLITGGSPKPLDDKDFEPPD